MCVEWSSGYVGVKEVTFVCVIKSIKPLSYLLSSFSLLVSFFHDVQQPARS